MQRQALQETARIRIGCQFSPPRALVLVPSRATLPSFGAAIHLEGCIGSHQILGDAQLWVNTHLIAWSLW